MSDAGNKLKISQQEQPVLESSSGDILISHEALPYPGAILRGFRKRQNDSEFVPEYEPYVDFGEIKELLEFLEHVVLCERLILAKPRLAKKTIEIAEGEDTCWDFSVYRLTGDLDFGTEELVNQLESAGVVMEAELHVGEATADDFISTNIQSNRWLKDRYAKFLEHALPIEGFNKTDYAKSKMAVFIGAPLHTAQAAGMAGVPYILGSREIQEVIGYEQENLRVRRSVTKILLDRLNRGARNEIEKLAELGPARIFPETPIAQIIVNRASNVKGLVDAALELRKEFVEFRKLMNQIESDLVQNSQPLSKRLRRMRELEFLANSLWKENKTDFRTTATSVSEALNAIPEVAAKPSMISITELATKLLALPVEKLIAVYRRRKIRLLINAKKNFLKNADATDKLAQIFGVSKEVAQKSRNMQRPALTSSYIKKYPEMAAAYQRVRS
jgi:hypothetical protein